MKQVKLKSVDSGSDSAVLNDQLMAVLKEISAFSSRIDEMDERELIHGFAPAFSYEQRLRDLHAKVQPGKEPAKPVIFLTRMVIECLNKGPMSEKDMKIIVLDRCKALGIKSSNRGLIAGTGMDIATVCSVLHALGAVEPVDPSNHPIVKTEATGSAEDSAAEAAGCPEQVEGPAAELYALLSMRWKERLGEYIDDAQKSKESAQSGTAASDTAPGCHTGTASVFASSSSGASTANPLSASAAAVSNKGASGGALVASGTGGMNAVKTAPPTTPAAVVPPSSSQPDDSSTSKSHNATIPANSSSSSATCAADTPATSDLYSSIFVSAQGKQVSTAAVDPTPASAAPSSSNQPSKLDTAGSAASDTSRVAAVSTAEDQPADSVDTATAPSTAICSSNCATATSTPLPTISAPVPLPATTIGGLGLRPVSSSLSTAAPSVPSSGNLVGIVQLPVASAGCCFALPNSFLSASVEFQQQLVASAPAAPTSVAHEGGAGIYTSMLSASGTPIAITASSTSTEPVASSGKPGKTRAPKAPKPPSEKKPPKKPSKVPADPVVPSAVPAATGTGSGSTNSNKARRGPSALRIWRLREEFVPYAAEISQTPAAVSSSNSHSSDFKAATTAGSMLMSSSNKSSTGTVLPYNNSNSSNNNRNVAMQLLLQPSLLVSTAAQADYTLQSALEVEEKLLRRLAGQCGITLKPSRFRVGTTYLSSNPEIMTETFRSRFVQNSAQFPSYYNKTGANLSNSSETNSEDYYRDAGESAEPKYTLYDESVHITSAYLLDKVRRTKRQRGDCLYGSITLPNNSSTSASVSAARNAAAASVGVFSAQHVHSLSAVCAKSQDYFWAASAAGSKSNSSKKKPPVPLSKAQNEAITMGQYAYNLHMGIPNPSGVAPVVLSSCSNGSSITNYTLRRYALPLHLVDAHMPMLDPTHTNSLFSAASSSGSSSKQRVPTVSTGSREVVRIPDLSLYTREIAWAEIAQEFTVLAAPVDEPGALPSSSSTLTLQDAASSDAASTASAMKGKKRKLSHCQGKTSANATLEDATQKLASIEVLAPQYKEITPISDIVRQLRQQQQQQTDENNSEATNGQTTAFMSGEGNDSGDEDTSDEAFGRRHEAVLQAMRDKWSLLQQLKNEALYGPGGAPPALGKTGGGGGYRSGGYGYYGGQPAAGSTSVSADATLTGIAANNLAVPAALSVPVSATPNGGRFQNLSPRKRGLASAHLKRRGRPPKITKYTGAAPH